MPGFVGGVNGSLHEPSLTVSTQSSVVVTPILTAFVIVLVMQNYNLRQGGHVWHVSAQAVEDILGLTYFPVGSPLSLPKFPKLCQYFLGRLHFGPLQSPFETMSPLSSKHMLVFKPPFCLGVLSFSFHLSPGEERLFLAAYKATNLLLNKGEERDGEIQPCGFGFGGIFGVSGFMVPVGYRKIWRG